MVDIGALTHKTAHSGIFHNLRPYNGQDHVMVGSGTMLPITHVGDAYVGISPNSIKLNNVLLVPDVEKTYYLLGN